MRDKREIKTNKSLVKGSDEHIILACVNSENFNGKLQCLIFVILDPFSAFCLDAVVHFGSGIKLQEAMAFINVEGHLHAFTPSTE